MDASSARPRRANARVRNGLSRLTGQESAVGIGIGIHKVVLDRRNDLEWHLGARRTVQKRYGLPVDVHFERRKL